MNYITTTNLRTQSSRLVESLKRGKKISLVHRSQIVGEILPLKTKIKIFDLKTFHKFINSSKKANNLSAQEREHIYKKHLEEKYGKDLS